MSGAMSQFLTLNRVTLALSESVNVAQRQARQRQVSTALEQVGIYPAMPPQAILVVRHLADPQPGQLLASNRWQGMRIWERAAQEALNDCWRTAVRVARSPVVANANAVWFADPAEWLACLSWDLARGIAGDRWWWQTVLRPYQQLDRWEILYSLWQAEIRWLPATFMLIFRHHAVSFRQIFIGLTATQIEQLLTQLTEVYQCPLPAIIFTQSALIQQVVIKKLEQTLTPSMRAFIQTLPPISRMLVAVCFNLVIAVDVQQILQDVFNAEPLENEPNSQLPLDDISQQTSVLNQAEILAEDLSLLQETPESEPEAIAATDAFFATNSADPALSNSELKTADPQNFSDPIFKIVEIKSTPLESAPNFESNLAEEPLNNVTPFPETGIDFSVGQSPDFELIDQGDRPVAEPVFFLIAEENLYATQGVQTSVGGLWYVVNILVALDWLGRSPLITPWQQLLILSQALLPEIPPDPVWGLLNEIVGEPLPDTVVAQWQSEILSHVADYLNLELELPKPMADYILEPATLYLTRTHIDVVFSLEQIQFDLRIAGLDRDPGWVPELARVIAFHYE
jgi:hypothetical protein